MYLEWCFITRTGAYMALVKKINPCIWYLNMDKYTYLPKLAHKCNWTWWENLDYDVELFKVNQLSRVYYQLVLARQKDTSKDSLETYRHIITSNLISTNTAIMGNSEVGCQSSYLQNNPSNNHFTLYDIFRIT